VSPAKEPSFPVTGRGAKQRKATEAQPSEARSAKSSSKVTRSPAAEGRRTSPTLPKTASPRRGSLGAPARALYMPTIRREYSDLERANYLQDAYRRTEAIFRAGARELNKKPDIKIVLTKHGLRKFTCEAYVKEKAACRCKVWLGLPSYSRTPEIGYSEGHIDISNDNSYNDAIHLANDTCELKLYAMTPFSTVREFNTSSMSAEDVAKYLWMKFAKSLEQNTRR
jgi:hypothetical protein